MKILIAMMKHETNTFSPIVTDWKRFQEWGAHLGPEIVSVYENTSMPIAAYIKIAKQIGATIVTPLAAEAMPSGKVTEETYEYMANLILDAAEDADCALLDLHGAMVAEHCFDGEGELLERIRRTRPGLPIAVTCDLHCNLTKRMVENSTALIGYKTYPHVDMYEVAEQVGTILMRALNNECTPTMSWRPARILSQTLKQGTSDEPMKSLISQARQAEEHEQVLAATVFGGFPLADVPDAGTSCVVITDNNTELAQKICDDILAKTWGYRKNFLYQHEPLKQAVARAKLLEKGPVMLLDHADNCGSGATQDVMTVIAEVLQQKLEDVIVGAVWDPVAVKEMQRAGVGSNVTIELGGKTDMPSIKLNGQPFSISGKVKVLTDGNWIVRGPMYTGVQVNMGPTALIDTGRMQIVVVSRHHEPWDIGIFTSVGIQPQHHRYILLKSRIHYRAGFKNLAKETITLDGNGVTTSDNTILTFKNIRRPIYPLDLINEQ